MMDEGEENDVIIEAREAVDTGPVNRMYMSYICIINIEGRKGVKIGNLSRRPQTIRSH